LLSICQVAGDKGHERSTIAALPAQRDDVKEVVEFLPHASLDDIAGLRAAVLAGKQPETSGEYTVLLDIGVEPLISWQELAAELKSLDTRDPAWAVAIGQTDARDVNSTAVVLHNALPLPWFSHTGNLRELALQLCTVATRLGYGSHLLKSGWKRNKNMNPSLVDQRAATDREEQRIRTCQEQDWAPTTCTVLYWGTSDWRRVWSTARSMVILQDPHYGEVRKLLAQRAGRWEIVVWLIVPFLKRLDDMRWWRKNWRLRCGF
jgi:hypothetical protein